MKEAIGLPMRLVTGYKGTADMRVAVESGEMDGLCGFSWVVGFVATLEIRSAYQRNQLVCNGPRVVYRQRNYPVSNLERGDSAGSRSSGFHRFDHR